MTFQEVLERKRREMNKKVSKESSPVKKYKEMPRSEHFNRMIASSPIHFVQLNHGKKIKIG